MNPVRPGRTRSDPRVSALSGDHPRKCDGVSGVPASPALRCEPRSAVGAGAHAPIDRRQHPAPPDAEPWEYTVVVSIRNDLGVEIARKLIGVGAITANEQRSFTLSVEATPTKGKPPGKGGTRH